MSEERVYGAPIEDESVVENPYESQPFASESYESQPYASASYVAQPAVEKKVAKKGLAIASLVLGIFALITTLFFINYIFGLLSLIFGIIYLALKADVKPKGAAITGVVLSVISIALSTTLWVSLFMYLTRTDLVTIVEDVASIMGEEIDAREVLNQTVAEMTDNAVTLDTIEQFVGEEVTIERITNFVGDVSEEDLKEFLVDIETMDQQGIEKLAQELEGEITYEKLEEMLGEDFTLEDIMDYVKKYQ